MAYMRSMIDMARTPEEVKKDQPPPIGEAVGPAYPWGLCISLEDDSLKKLKLDGELPSVGDMIHLFAMAKVTSVSENERENTRGEKTRCCRVELQITHLATEDEDNEAPSREERMDRRYRAKSEDDY